MMDFTFFPIVVALTTIFIVTISAAANMTYITFNPALGSPPSGIVFTKFALQIIFGKILTSLDKLNIHLIYNNVSFIHTILQFYQLNASRKLQKD